jgi:hypothetical protein
METNNIPARLAMCRALGHVSYVNKTPGDLMSKTLLVLLALLASPAIAAPPPAPIEVMVVGTYHFDNPGHDKVNMNADDVTTPARQRELAALADAIAGFRPTRVMVEAERPGPGFDVAEYRRFTPALLASDRNEIVQIGYRIAARAKLAAVQGIDEQPGAGEPDYFPYDKVEAWAKAHGEQPALDAVFAGVKAASDRIAAEQASRSIPALLLTYNDPASPLAGQDSYYALLRFGDGDAQPGAELNAMWYLRNAKIFAKLINVAKPGDRIVVVYGAGHGYWLRHFAETTPGFRLVDVRPYLEKAAAALR